MTEANKAILNAAAEKLTAALAALTAGQTEITRLDKLAKEYERQIAYHNQLGNIQDAENVAVTLNNVYSLLLAQKATIKVLQADYDQAFAGYQAAQTLLSAEEKAEIAIIAQSNAAVATAQAQENATRAEAEASAVKSEFFAKNVKYFIIGAIVLVLAIGAIIYFKRSKKVA